MSVDYHVHLEEGPYSFRWLERTSRALQHFYPVSEGSHHRSWIQSSYKLLNERLEKGPYSSEWLDLYLQKAKERSLKEVGIVDHLYRFRETRDYFEKHMDIGETDLGRKQYRWLNQVMTEHMGDFVDFIESQKQKWAEHGIKLKLGMEADYFPGCHNQLKELLSAHRWDYVIGSVHFVDGWGFDNPEAIDRFEHYELVDLYGRFFQIVEEAIRSGLFDFVAHLDNLKVFNFRPHEEILLPHYEKIARALVDTNTATEVNAGLFYRYPIKEMCPSPNFLQVLIEAGVKFTTSSDSHFPDDIGRYVNENTERLKALGVHQIATF
ncbi:histidinol phosphate phosphatase domain-containing protein [Rossellomorea vietnamensis]|uniref:Histidinol phosphate phosphatase domain-containing protein n=1 Tax=Rossellomorea vietnamensis TaxID=218284 RepID=A0ACD4CCA5_9BACI|nr:histidinol phosphate phosphatase domain-containing protein [Rossellomorea vietnamensis]UXH46165.1 histidinol phosphate phosphatase domain-containing protein [Rossellomorea vietnamensis]